MKKLTSRQREVLQFIHDNTLETGYPPTRVEIARNFGFRSANAAEEHLRALKKKMVLDVLSGASRAVRLTAQGYQELGIDPDDVHGKTEHKSSELFHLLDSDAIPLITNLTPNEPLLAKHNIEFGYHLDPNFFNHEIDYFYRMPNNQMQSFGFNQDDLLAVKCTETFENNDFIVACLDGKPIVMQYQRDGTLIRLQSNKEHVTEISISESEKRLDISGKIVGLVRAMKDNNS